MDVPNLNGLEGMGCGHGTASCDASGEEGPVRSIEVSDGRCTLRMAQLWPMCLYPPVVDMTPSVAARECVYVENECRQSQASRRRVINLLLLRSSALLVEEEARCNAAADGFQFTESPGP